ncbi:nucleotidyltransferase domain-containing protein [Kribbella sp. DT2]|uniref:nucleotidyltransferase domain-containing protein n=1 Tax=Kribbella sp. DT2 TaxID=3393427 RepID=UPI003CEC2FFA
MFTPAERSALRDQLVAEARSDARITGLALTGSAAAGAEDEWSDIDLYLGLAGDPQDVLDEWTTRMYAEHSCVAHLDLRVRRTTYRVFFLASTLQVDVAFAPAAEFGALGPAFQVVFGDAVEQPAGAPPDAAGLIGMGWLYALHARSSIMRGRGWQAEHMISGLRDQVLMLACLRHQVPAGDGRGYHLLPPALLRPLEATLLRAIDPAELDRAFGAAIQVFLDEVALVDPALASRLSAPLRELSLAT